jgi:hypothetical protein
MEFRKNVVHCPSLEAKIELIRSKWLEATQSVFYELDNDGNTKELANHVPKRSFEFTLDKQLYLADAAKYYCTHHAKNLILSERDYILAITSRERFIDATIGQYKEQTHKLLNDLKEALTRFVYVPNELGGYTVMQPFGLVYDTNVDFERISEIRFRFSKLIFGKYLEGGQYFRQPKNLTAKLYDIVSKWDVNAWEQERLGRKALLDYNTLLSDKVYLASYIRFFDYLCLHGAGDKRHDKITVDIRDMLPKVAPSLCKIDNKLRVFQRDKEQSIAFLKAAELLGRTVEGFDFQIVKVRVIAPKIVYKLKHP